MRYPPGTTNAEGETRMLRLVHFLFALAIVLTSSSAFAAFSLASGYPQREGGDSRPVALAGGVGTTAPNPLSQPTAGFNRADCFDTTSQNVKILLTDIPTEATDIEIWARRDNTSCADPANRPGGANVQCWKVAHWTRDEAINKVVTFKPIQVIEAIDKQISVDTADGLDPVTVCAKDSHMTPVLTYLQIMAFNSGTVVGWSSGGGTTGAVIAIPTAYDLAGPNPPTDVKVGAGNKLLVMSFTAVSQPVADFDGYKVYCFSGSAVGSSSAPIGTKAGDGGLTDGGFVDDAAVDDASTTDTGTSTTSDGGIPEGCPSGFPFVEGELPSQEAEKYVCQSGVASSTGKITVDGLENDVPYAIAVAARDKAGNSGVLSAIGCGTPKQTDDFYTVYRSAGGTAGGGWCAIGSPRGATFGLSGIALALALAARLVRRGRR